MSEEIDITQASLISTMLLFPERVLEITEATHKEWYTGYFRKAFDHLAKHGGADPASLASAIGVSASVVCGWMDQEFSTAFLSQHMENLEREASLRKVQYLGNQLLKTSTLDEAMGLIERFGNSLSVKDGTEPKAIKKGLALLMKEIERRHELKGNILGMTYGIADLDEKTEGMHRGDLIVVAGPPSMGKTAFALGAAESAAACGHKGLIFSCEMTTEQLLMRSVSAHSNIPLGVIRSARLRDWEWGKFTNSVGEMSSWPLMIDDPAGIALSELVRKVRRAKKVGLDFVLVDYLQIMKYDKGRENQELDTITTALKNLAKELQVCMVILSQLSRGNQKEKRKPTMSDLRGSGMIEANADVILFPYREAAECQQCQDKVETAEHSTKIHQSRAEIIIGKQRQGERNISVKALWVGEKTRFVGLAKE
jgi:replicative DNA helicase